MKKKIKWAKWASENGSFVEVKAIDTKDRKICHWSWKSYMSLLVGMINRISFKIWSIIVAKVNCCQISCGWRDLSNIDIRSFPYILRTIFNCFEHLPVLSCILSQFLESGRGNMKNSATYVFLRLVPRCHSIINV